MHFIPSRGGDFDIGGVHLKRRFDTAWSPQVGEFARGVRAGRHLRDVVNAARCVTV